MSSARINKFLRSKVGTTDSHVCDKLLIFSQSFLTDFSSIRKNRSPFEKNVLIYKNFVYFKLKRLFIVRKAINRSDFN